MKQNEQNYEKKYKEALDRASHIKDYNTIGTPQEIAELFPELKESEDEKMLRTIIRGFENWKSNGMETFNNTKVDDILAYLEKQKEQKPVMKWKPMPESLEALMYAIEGKWEMIKPTDYLSRRLEDLYEGLVNTFNVDESYLNKLSEAASADDIEKLKAIKRKIEESMDQKPVWIKTMKQTLEQKECIWDIPEDKRHCEYCTANCNKVPTISTTYVLEEIKPEAFKAGAEWQKKQDELTWEDVKQIMSIADMLIVSNEPSKFPTEQRFYKEVLKEFTTPSE